MFDPMLWILKWLRAWVILHTVSFIKHRLLIFNPPKGQVLRGKVNYVKFCINNNLVTKLNWVPLIRWPSYHARQTDCERIYLPKLCNFTTAEIYFFVRKTRSTFVKNGGGGGGRFGHLINLAVTKLRPCKSKVFSFWNKVNKRDGETVNERKVQLILFPKPEWAEWTKYVLLRIWILLEKVQKENRVRGISAQPTS